VHILHIQRGPKEVCTPFRRHFLRLSGHSIRWLWHSCDWHHLLREYHTTHRTLRFGSIFKMSADNL
jgi:hypothetical protein